MPFSPELTQFSEVHVLTSHAVKKKNGVYCLSPAHLERNKKDIHIAREEGNQMALNSTSHSPSTHHEDSVPPSTSRKAGGWRAIAYILGNECQFGKS